MSKSLFYQFNSAIDLNYRHHFNKHGDKHNPESDSSHIVKSLSAKSNLKDFAHDFSAYIRQEYSVKQIKEITPEMCDSYIKSKYDTCSLKTIKTYQSNLLKLSKCANKTFNIRTDFSVSVDESKIEKTETIKQYSFTRAEMEKIFSSAPRQCESLSALRLAYAFGLRVSSISRLEVRNVDFKGNTLHVIRDKGNRSRILHFDDETAKLLRELIKGKQPQQKIVNISPSSINTYLRRRCEKLNIKNEKGEIKSGCHAIRKLWAEQFAEKNGVKKTMVALGHGEDRKDLEDTYLHSKK